MQRVIATFTSPDYRPPVLPDVAMELLELSRNPDVKVDGVVALLEKDPVIAGRVLKLVQSAAYAGLTNIRSLRQAVIRLGLATLRDVVMEVALGVRLFVAPGYRESMEQLRLHSTATAHITRILCRHAAKSETGLAFLCGLLHDVGMAGMLIVLASEGPVGSKPPLEPYWAEIDAAHQQVSGIIARAWKLPDEVVDIISHHHRHGENLPITPLEAIVCLSEEVANGLGAGAMRPSDAPMKVDVNPTDKIGPARACLGISPDAWSAVVQEASRLLPTLTPGS
jgi:putative nucleotidyltransferase with HDIG domain